MFCYPIAGSVHLLPDLLLQSGRGRSLAVAPSPSLDLLCGTVCRLNFGSSTVVLHFVDGWSHFTFNWLLINFYNAQLFLSTVYVNGALQIIAIIKGQLSLLNFSDLLQKAFRTTSHFLPGHCEEQPIISQPPHGEKMPPSWHWTGHSGGYWQ